MGWVYQGAIESGTQNGMRVQARLYFDDVVSGRVRNVLAETYLVTDARSINASFTGSSLAGGWGGGSTRQFAQGFHQTQHYTGHYQGVGYDANGEVSIQWGAALNTNNIIAFSQSVVQWVALPAIAPLALTGLSVARVSDTQHTLSWSRPGGVTTTEVVVQRRTNDGAWVQVARPAGNILSFTDSTTVANRKYVYRVAGVRHGRQAAWTNESTVYTTPAPPSAVSAEKVGFNIAVTATGLAPYATAHDVYDNGSLVGSDVTFPWTHVAPNAAVTHTYTVKAKRGSLVSAFSTPSNTVQLLAAPNAPAGLFPNGGTVAEDESITFKWVHNPVDTTAQTEYEIEFRFDPSFVWTTLAGSGPVSEHVFGQPPISGLEWRVRTKGQHPDWSPWSAVATVDAITRPGVAVVFPVGPVGISWANVEWTWFQPEGRPQSAWRAELIRNGVLVEAASGSGAALSHQFTAPLIDGGTYTVQVQAAAGNVWSAWSVETFTTVFPPPAAPDVVGTWVEATGKHSLQITPGAMAVFAWLGDENESPSTMTIGETVTTNLVPNPLLSGELDGWVSTGGVPSWSEGLSVSLGPGEGVYIDLGVVDDPVVSARVLVDATTPYRVAVFDPTGTSVAHWSDEYVGQRDVLMEALTVEPGKPLRVYVSLDSGGPLNVSRVTVVPGTSVSRAFDGNSSDEVGTEYMMVERSFDQDVWEPVAAALIGASVIEDGEGLSRGSTWYRVTAVSDLPSTAVTIVEVVSDSGSIWLSGGVGYGVTARLPFNPKLQITPGRARAAFQYAGRPLPVAYAGGAVSRQVNVAGSLYPDHDGEPSEGVDGLTVLAQHPSPIHLVRDPDGRRIYGVISEIPMPREQVGVWAYSFTLTETDH